MNSLRIGIDASRVTAVRRTGTENYSLYLIRALLELNSEKAKKTSPDTLTLYFNTPPSVDLFPQVSNYELRVMPFARLWTHLRLSTEMVANPPDILFVPAHVLPIRHPRRSVVTIHDLGYLYYPETHPTLDRLYLKWSTAYNARCAMHIITDSYSTKNDIIQNLRVDPVKISVVYPGASEEFQPVSEPNKISGMRRKYGIDGEYLLYLGTLHPRKNVIRLIDAYTKLWQYGRVKARLVLAGKKGWLPHEIFQRIKRAKAPISLTGFFPPEDLSLLMSGATAFIMPSLYEGFGLPVLEAMRCGTPVIVAKASSLPEVVGDAGIQFDPLDVDDMAEAIYEVLNNDDLRHFLREKGLEQAKKFTWDSAAEITLSLLRQIARY